VTRIANYVVAYEATDRGRDAVQLGIALARLTAAELRICLVLPTSSAIPAKVPTGASVYDSLLEKQGKDWLSEALGLVPPDVVATAHLLWAESTSEGLIEASTQFDSDRIVVGASSRGVLQRFTVGSIASALLHASPVPVALAPRGYVAPAALSRITCATGMRPGWKVLLKSMAAISDGLPVDLRFVTLVEVDAARSGSESADSAAHLASVIEHFESESGSKGTVTTEVAEGRTVEDAVENLDWRADEIALVGSSRLAQPSRIFLGVTAHRMLHSLPVPLVVVPTSSPS
jgi:nucleotide-binding universal stress UspA family protein